MLDLLQAADPQRRARLPVPDGAPQRGHDGGVVRITAIHLDDERLATVVDRPHHELPCPLAIGDAGRGNGHPEARRRALRTRSRLGRPALDPNTRCTAAADTAAISNPATAPSGVVAPSTVTESAASTTSQRPSRRTGSARCGDAVSTTAAADGEERRRVPRRRARGTDDVAEPEPLAVHRPHHDEAQRHRDHAGEHEVAHRPSLLAAHGGDHDHGDRNAASPLGDATATRRSRKRGTERRKRTHRP